MEKENYDKKSKNDAYSTSYEDYLKTRYGFDKVEIGNVEEDDPYVRDKG